MTFIQGFNVVLVDDDAIGGGGLAVSVDAVHAMLFVFRWVWIRAMSTLKSIRFLDLCFILLAVVKHICLVSNANNFSITQ